MRSDFSTAPAASSPGSILLMPKSEHFSPPLPEIVGTAPAMQDVYRLVRLAAPRSANILLIGETGTGKEVIAKAVHKLSKRADGPFIRVNCGALHENLLESELFGHIKGSFTGAVENKTGRFEAAHGGTIFLDEINSTSHKLQVKLLRVLQEREFERVGESRTIRVDVRVIAATNTSLEQAVEDREFRESNNIPPITVPNTTIPLYIKITALIVTIIGFILALELNNTTYYLKFKYPSQTYKFSNILGYYPSIIHRLPTYHNLSISQKSASSLLDLI